MTEGTHNYADVIGQLRVAYDGSAAQRDEIPKTAWKLDERAGFLERLLSEGKTRLLEVGAGTGHDSLFFQEAGFSVVATDLSAEMVARCRAKGLEAHAMDFLELQFPVASFDAVYALNCLLHVPNVELPQVLASIRDLLAPGGLFFLGVYGGEPFEGISPDDWHDPPRFFSFRSDDVIQDHARRLFEIVDFHVVDPEGAHFQSLTLRKW
jgi:SAM-dependent methyltransferase